MATSVTRCGCFCRKIYISNKLLNAPIVYANTLVVQLQRRQKLHVYASSKVQSQYELPSGLHSFHITTFQPVHLNVRCYTTKSKDEEDKPEKLTLFQKFKKMYKEYWYVLVPVHLVTSAAWFGGFYYLAKSGVDIVAILESVHISEKIINPLRDSSMGYVAVAYGLYKIATPVRYTVTLGGTTISINYLKKWGYIKPVPTAEQLKEIYYEKRENLMETVRETKEELKSKADKIKDQKDHIMDDLEKGIQKFKQSSSESIKIKKKDIVDNINKGFEKNPSK